MASRAESRERTRRQLLDAAGRLFFDRGFGTTSLDDIAAEAGLTKGAVYSNFASKGDLLIALLEEVEPAIVDVTMFDGEGTFGEQLRRFGSSIAERRDDRLVAAQCEYTSHAIRDERAGEVYGALVTAALRMAGAMVEAGLGAERDGRGSHFDATEIVVLIDSFVQGLLMRRAVVPDLVPDDLIVRAISLLVSAIVIDVVDADEALALRAERYGPRP